MKKYDLSDLHIYQTITYTNNESLRIPVDTLPHENSLGVLIDNRQTAFADITYKNIFYEGGYGILYKSLRKDLSSNEVRTVMVKRPDEGASLREEALIQWLAWTTLNGFGLGTAVPQVYDIFLRQKKVCFSMEFVDGCFPHEYLFETKTPDVFFFQMVAQVALLCLILEKNILLDHRDLKGNNVYIRKREVEYEFTMDGATYVLKAPFQVVILDFGFACLGNERGTSAVNLGQARLPSSDPCPKEGRDLFHFVTSFWSIPSIRALMKKETLVEVESLLFDGETSHAAKFRTPEQLRWVYVITGKREFRFPQLSPANILKTLNERHPAIVAGRV